MDYKDIMKFGEIQYLKGRLDELHKGYVPNTINKENRIVDSRISKYEDKLKSLDEISYLVLTQAKELTGSRFGFVGHIDLATGYLISSTLTRDIWETCQVAGKSVVFEKFSGFARVF